MRLCAYDSREDSNRKQAGHDGPRAIADPGMGKKSAAEFLSSTAPGHQSAKLPARVLIAGFVMAQPAEWRAAVSIDYVGPVPCEIRHDGQSHRDSPCVPSSTLRASLFVQE